MDDDWPLLLGHMYIWLVIVNACKRFLSVGPTMTHFTYATHIVGVNQVYRKTLFLHKERPVTHLTFKLDFVVPLPLVFYKFDISILGMNRLQRKAGYKEEE